MAPNGESLPLPLSLSSSLSRSNDVSKPPRQLPVPPSSNHIHHNHNSIQRTFSDISFELSKEGVNGDVTSTLTAITEVEDAKCECCGMSEECTHEYIERVRGKFLGKFVCGLCSEAVKEELEKNGGKKNKEEALSAHMSACVRFNKFGRSFPVLFQAQAMKEMLKKSKMEGRRARSFNPRDHNKKGSEDQNKGGLARSSSCIPAITREINDFTNSN